MIESQILNEPVRHAAPAALIHDMRTPLNQIIGYTDLLIDQAQEAGYEELSPDLVKVRSAGNQLLSLINGNFYPIPGAYADTEAPKESDGMTGPIQDEPGMSEQPSEGAQRRFLVVDDIEANRDVLSRRLIRQGHVVVTAENGKQALELMRTSTFDLVLLDIMMPEMDGYEVLRRVKSDKHLQHVPVIMISALGELDSVALCIEMGAEDYLTKPFNPTLLTARIGACLGKKLAHDREMRLFEQLQENFKRLQDLEILRDNLTNMIIHDLRTPLASVIAGMQTLDMIGELNVDQREMTQISITGGETLLGMINDLLDVEKLESAAMDLDYILTSVPQLISTAIGQVASLAHDKQLTFIRDVPMEIPYLMGDESKLVRTLVNLLGNAIKFTPSGGAITVAVVESKDENSLRFSIVDTGEGIPAEAFGRIFEKFGQVAARKAGRTMSTGLGLTFCKLAVEAHGGQIGVESVPGHGSTFWFTIPLTTPESSAK